MSLRIVCKAAATTFLSLTVSLGATADDRLLTIDDLLALKSVSDPQINSDGDLLVTYKNKGPDRYGLAL